MSKTYEFRMLPGLWRKVLLGAKTAECRLGDKAQRVRPGDFLRLVNVDDGQALERLVRVVMLYQSLPEAEPGDPWLEFAGFDDWEAFHATMREFYSYRVNREPLTVMYLEEVAVQNLEEVEEATE